jgi:hypothetical protein
VAVVGAERWPATGFSGGRRRWPRRLGENRRGGEMFGNKRTRELHWELGKLIGQLDGGEHGRRAPAPGSGGNGGGGSGLARARARGA